MSNDLLQAKCVAVMAGSDLLATKVGCPTISINVSTSTIDATKIHDSDLTDQSTADTDILYILYT